MQKIELNRKELENECNSWARRISESYQPDLIIYIAKGGYLIGREMREVFNVPMIGIGTSRDGNNFKEKIGPFVAMLPNFVRNFLILIEMKSNKHGKSTERHVHFLDNIEEKIDVKTIKNILVAEDSVDTGHSLKQSLEEIKKVFPDAKVKVASLNVWDKSKDIVSVDYALYQNAIIKTPMSKDSKEYKAFIETYKEETKSGCRKICDS